MSWRGRAWRLQARTGLGMNVEALVPLLDYASVLVFALTGALVASRGQLDVVASSSSPR